MSQLTVVCKRELGSYFATPLAYVFILIFLVLSGVFTFYMGGFYESGQADLAPFFNFHPWLYLFLIPALAMRLWAEERKSGTIELLMTLPITRFQAVTGKFLAAWVFAGLALLLTFPMVLTVNYLGQPDNGAIVTGYLGSWLLAGLAGEFHAGSWRFELSGHGAWFAAPTWVEASEALLSTWPVRR